MIFYFLVIVVFLFSYVNRGMKSNEIIHEHSESCGPNGLPSALCKWFIFVLVRLIGWRMLIFTNRS